MAVYSAVNLSFKVPGFRVHSVLVCRLKDGEFGLRASFQRAAIIMLHAQRLRAVQYTMICSVLLLGVGAERFVKTSSSLKRLPLRYRVL